MKRRNIQRTQSGPRRKSEKQKTKNKRRGRQRTVSPNLKPLKNELTCIWHVQLKSERTKAKNDYIKEHNVDPSPLLEYTDNMTEELSELGSEDEEKNSAHKAELVNKAGLTPREIESGVPVWEIVRPGHRSEEVRMTEWISVLVGLQELQAAKVLDTLDTIR